MTHDERPERDGPAYCGTELELFAGAVNWKAYWARHVRGVIQGDVLEVGAGIGANTKLLCGERVRRWVCVEPDARLAAQIPATMQAHAHGGRVEVVAGTIEHVRREEAFDAILYLDVLEHIAADRAELTRAAERLRVGGALVVLAPAWPSLYAPFDAAVGHRRRYTRRTLQGAVPRGLVRLKLISLDSCGLLASLGNRVLLRRRMPSAGQLRFWDRVMVPVSRVLDRLTLHRLGKSVLGIWRKEEATGRTTRA